MFSGNKPGQMEQIKIQAKHEMREMNEHEFYEQSRGWRRQVMD
jgi:hypothetical protein